MLPIVNVAWFSNQPHLPKVLPSYLKHPVLVLINPDAHDHTLVGENCCEMVKK